jgi:RHS repeat-associated protein
LYSVAATTNVAGAVVERYSYNAYGVRTVKNPAGATLAKSAVNQYRGFTGYKLDAETGLMYARARMYSSKLGRFVSHDPWMESETNIPNPGDGYKDGYNLYAAYFVPNGNDPSGMGFWSYLTCLNNCIQANDPIDLALAKALGLIAGTPLPKAWVATTADTLGLSDLARAVRISMGTPGASSTTTLPSALSAAIRGGGRTGLRTLGRFAAPVVVGYGLALAALEVACAAHCTVNCNYTPPLNFNPLNFF